MLAQDITMRTPITTVKYPPVKASAAADSINIISSYGVEKINVQDLNGNQVVSEDASLQKEILLETSSLSKSVYIIEVVSEEKTESVKVMM